MKSKVIGNIFEQLFFRSAATQGIGILRIPDGCKRIPSKMGVKMIPVKTPCDYVVMHEGKCLLVDTKTQGGGQTFPKANINTNQVMSMNYMANHGALGGYICWFREIDRVIFYPSELLRLAESGLHWEDGLYLGPIEEINIKLIFERYLG